MESATVAQLAANTGVDDQVAKITSEPKATPRPVLTCLAIPLGILSSLSINGFFPR
jgi:hypothetical protein